MNDKPTDYAAILKAGNQVPSPPEWLEIGNQVYCPKYGIGQITAVLGKRLIVDFLENHEPVHFSDWQIAINEKQIEPRDITILNNDKLKPPEKSKINSAEIEAICRPVFKNIAKEFL